MRQGFPPSSARGRVGEGREAVAHSEKEPASAEAESAWVDGSVSWKKGNRVIPSRQPRGISPVFESPLSATLWV